MLLFFSPMTEDDLPKFVEIRNSAVEFLHTKISFTLEETQEWFKTLKTPFYSIFYKNEMIGYFRTSNLNDAELTGRSLYVGADLAVEYREKGIGSELYPIFLHKVFTYYKLDRVFLEVLPTNKRAIHFYKKLGFITLFSNSENIVMELTKDDFYGD